MLILDQKWWYRYPKASKYWGYGIMEEKNLSLCEKQTKQIVNKKQSARFLLSPSWNVCWKYAHFSLGSKKNKYKRKSSGSASPQIQCLSTTWATSSRWVEHILSNFLGYLLSGDRGTGREVETGIMGLWKKKPSGLQDYWRKPQVEPINYWFL